MKRHIFKAFKNYTLFQALPTVDQIYCNEFFAQMREKCVKNEFGYFTEFTFEIFRNSMAEIKLVTEKPEKPDQPIIKFAFHFSITRNADKNNKVIQENLRSETDGRTDDWLENNNLAYVILIFNGDDQQLIISCW